MKGFLEAFAGEVLKGLLKYKATMKAFWEAFVGEVFQKTFQNTKLL